MSPFRTFAAAAAALSLFAVTPAFAGDDPRNYFALPDALEMDGVRVEFVEIWAEKEWIKVKAKLTNETADYVFFHKHEAEFDVKGLGKLKAHDGKKKSAVVIAPKKSKTHTWKIDGEGGFLVEEFELTVDGLARVDSDGEVHEAPSFLLPASRNDFDAGPFKCKLIKKVLQETKETRADFRCTYKGEAIGWLDPASLGMAVIKASEKAQDDVEGMEFANDAKSTKKIMLTPGDKGTFQALFHVEYRMTDMQFSTLEILWRNTFAESKLVPIDSESVDFELDAALTKEKAE